MDKEHILSEIRRTAIDGTALGWRRFEGETGIRYHDWCGQFWARWGDAVREAGFQPNRMVKPFDDEFLVLKLVELTRRLKHVPTNAEIKLARRTDTSFPSEKVFRRLGHKPERAARILAFCEVNPGFDDVATLWADIASAEKSSKPEAEDLVVPVVGYVYLLRHGTRREYKIGRTNNPLRREGEIGIQLPEESSPIHYIETDDPAGVENYWHKRFASKRKKGEWFSLTAADVRAFQRWKRIY